MAPRWKSDYPRRPPRFAWLRSCLPLLVIVILFSFLLSSVALLSHFRSPASKQQLGWQAWDVVEMHYANKAGSEENVTQGNEVFTPSIPLDVWDPLSAHTTGMTEITVHACYFPPYLLPSYCEPPSTPEEDKAKGKWVMIPKDLNLRTGIWYLNVYYRRTRRLDVPLITDIRVVPEPIPQTLESDLEGWTQAKGDLHDGIWPTQPVMRLWYRVTDQSNLWRKQEIERQGMTGDDQIVTELDIVYGDGEPFFGFQRVQGGKVLDEKPGKWESVDLAYRKGNPVPTKAEVPRFHSDGTFKIMQIADLHFSVGSGECRDTDKVPCTGDTDTIEWLQEALDAEKPDLVVFSGDQLNGQKTSYDARSVMSKFTKPVIDRQIPWCAIFGNHDSEIAEDRVEQMRALQNLPYSLAQPGPKDVDGVGNYVIKLHSADASRMHIFTLYFLDSGSYQRKTLPWVDADYDYIKEYVYAVWDKLWKWFLNTSSHIKPIERPFTPDGAADLDKIWRRQSPSASPARLPHQARQKKLAKPNAMMWFHIPLQEAYNAPDHAGLNDDELMVGSFDDGKGSSKHNSGFFYNGIKEAFEADVAGDMMSSPISEVKVLGHGHTHNTDMCRRVDGIWVCFDGGTSYSGYGKVGFDRRVRVYQLSAYGEKIETYKRLTSGDVIDRQVLVGDGAPDGAGV